jgi:hypothetical protein
MPADTGKARAGDHLVEGVLDDAVELLAAYLVGEHVIAVLPRCAEPDTVF